MYVNFSFACEKIVKLTNWLLLKDVYIEAAA